MQYNPTPWLQPPPPSTTNRDEDPSMFRFQQSVDLELAEQKIKADIQKLYNELCNVQNEKNFIAQNLMTPQMVEILGEIVHACKHFDDGIFYEDLRKKFERLSFHLYSATLRALNQRGLIEYHGSFRKRRIKATPVGTGVAALLGGLQ